MKDDFNPFEKAHEITKPKLPKRFYKEVTTAPFEGGFGVFLDGRAIKTPSKMSVILPTESLARLMVAEWEAQKDEINPALMPVTKLVNSTLEMVAPNPSPIIDELAGFAAHDLVCYRAENPQSLCERQSEAWDRLVDMMQAKLGVRYHVTCGVLSIAQPEGIFPSLKQRLSALSAFEIAALHNMSTLSTSLSIGLCVLEGDIAPEEGWQAAHVDEDWNISQWGEDFEAKERRESRWREFEACARLIKAVQQ